MISTIVDDCWIGLEEAAKYMGVTKEDTYNMTSRVSPTDYAIESGAWVAMHYRTADGNIPGCWWLRSPGYRQSSAANVVFDGSLDLYQRIDYEKCCVRPAMWVNLESGIF